MEEKNINNQVDSDQQTSFKIWWKKYHNHVYGIGGIMGVLLTIIFYAFPKTDTSNFDDKHFPETKSSINNHSIDPKKKEQKPLIIKEITEEQILTNTIDSLKQIFSFVSSSKNGRIRVMKNGKYGFTDIKGKSIIDNTYNSAGDFDSFRAIVNLNDSQIIIDTSGVIIKEMNPNIRIIDDEFFYGFARIHDLKAGKIGFINQNGETVIPSIYDKAGAFRQGIARVLKNNKWGYINNKGKQITPHIYDDCWAFKNGMATVSKKSSKGKFKIKSGYINLNGEEVIPLIYDFVFDFQEGFGLVYSHPKFMYLDYSGREVNPLSNYKGASIFNDGQARVIQAKDTFCIDLNFHKIECSSSIISNIYTYEGMKETFKESSFK